MRLRATRPKPFYRPGDRIELEVRCLGAVTEDPIVVYNPTLERDMSGAMVPDLPRCPSSRFEIEVPADFIGKNSATATAQLGERRFSSAFKFEVRTTAKLADLQLSTDGPTEGCSLEIFKNGPAQSDLDLFAVMQDGTRLDLCWEGRAAVTVEPAGAGTFKIEKGRCALTPRKAEPFKVVATYRGLRKEWPCAVDVEVK